eukprot:TCALIF_13169-PA protein Name:"Protein of unknown function" AED:0.24 eAED:0.24 QI:0/-1/0/1/-1/1/1/0/189
MYYKALTLLKNRYGDSRVLRVLHLNKPRAIEKVREGDPSSMNRFSIEIQGLLAGLNLESSESQHLLAELEEKLPLNEKIQWRRFRRINGDSMQAFSEWVGELAQDARNIMIVNRETMEKNHPREKPRSSQTYSTTVETKWEFDWTSRAPCAQARGFLFLSVHHLPRSPWSTDFSRFKQNRYLQVLEKRP